MLSAAIGGPYDMVVLLQQATTKIFLKKRKEKCWIVKGPLNM
jgi:hypothetical protein